MLIFHSIINKHLQFVFFACEDAAYQGENLFMLKKNTQKPSCSLHTFLLKQWEIKMIKKLKVKKQEKELIKEAKESKIDYESKSQWVEYKKNRQD